MPAEFVTKLHVLILEPPPKQDQKAASDDVTLLGTPSGATMVLDPHDGEGLILGQLCFDKVCFRQMEQLLYVSFSKDTWHLGLPGFCVCDWCSCLYRLYLDCQHRLFLPVNTLENCSPYLAEPADARKCVRKLRNTHSGLHPADASPDHRQYSRVTFTVESFGGLQAYNEKQRSNIVAYMKELASLSTAAGFSVVNSKGEAKIRGKAVQYPELCLRTPSYLLSKWKQHKTGSFGACNSFGEYVLTTFRRLLPQPDGGDDPCANLRKFMAEVDKESLPVLLGAGR